MPALDEDTSTTVVAAPARTAAVAPASGDARPKHLPPYAVILHNDDKNTFEFVIETLAKVFHYDEQRAVQLTMEAHRAGRAAVWLGAKEHAELKVEQIRSRGAGPVMAHAGALPLRATIEPLAR